MNFALLDNFRISLIYNSSLEKGRRVFFFYFCNLISCSLKYKFLILFLHNTFIFMNSICFSVFKTEAVLQITSSTSGVRMCQAIRCGAENRQMHVDNTVNAVKTIKQTLFTTIAAYFHSAIMSFTRSSRRIRLVM